MTGRHVQADIPAVGLIGDDAAKDILTEAGAAILASVNLSFRNSESPHGDKWPVLSETTIRQRRKGSSKPLIDTGVLMNSYQVSDVYSTTSGAAIDVGSNMEYAAIHNFGGMAGRNKKVRIPKRQALPEPDDMPRDLAEELAEIGITAIMRAL